MDGGLITEPDLTQAVRIVLKYEIQSLLSRLSETGEEYIVLTASLDEGTCGHIGSEKGEVFVKSSGLHVVEQNFLDFCKGKENSPPPAQSVNATSTPRPNRRKSTPKCKLQARPPPMVAQMEDPVLSEISESVKDADYTTTSGVSTDSLSALDLSEKPESYSYTLDSKDEVMKYNGTVLQSSFPGFHYEELENTDSLLKVKLPRFTWQDEKLKPLDQDLNPSSIDNFTLDAQDNDVNQNKNAILNQIAFPDLVAFGGTASSVGEKQQPDIRNRRKNRKAPMKIQRKPKQVVNIDQASSSFVDGNSENGVNSFDNQISSPKGVEDSGNSAVANNSRYAMKTGASHNFKKTGKKPVANHFMDMKSAFEEIGNMAKCLICNKILANKNNRTFHWRSHVGDKRYTCDICNKAFTHPSNMRSHRKIHTDEKPFPCDLCERRFRRRDYLLQHLERFHYNPKQPTEKTSTTEGETATS